MRFLVGWAGIVFLFRVGWFCVVLVGWGYGVVVWYFDLWVGGLCGFLTGSGCGFGFCVGGFDVVGG